MEKTGRLFICTLLLIFSASCSQENKRATVAEKMEDSAPSETATVTPDPKADLNKAFVKTKYPDEDCVKHCQQETNFNSASTECMQTKCEGDQEARIRCEKEGPLPKYNACMEKRHEKFQSCLRSWCHKS